jgi:hypothetical protein
VDEARIYSLEEYDPPLGELYEPQKRALEKMLFRAKLASGDVLEFEAVIPEAMPPRRAVWFKTPEGPRAFALGWNGNTGAVNPIELDLDVRF